MMKKDLKFTEILLLGGLIFGLFFGAGNLIFPVYLGQNAGVNSLQAFLGFIVTAVGLPLLGIIALGISNFADQLEASSKFNKKFAVVFTTLLYLIIGPLLIVPRNAAVSYDMCFSPFINGFSIYQIIFYLIYFLIVLLLTIKPGKLVFWISKVLNPMLLIMLAILFLACLIKPMSDLSSITTSYGYYSKVPFINGFIDGYNTCDALGSMATGFIVIETIKSHGINKHEDIKRNLLKICAVAALLLIVIYALCVYLGATSLPLNGLLENGNQILQFSAYHYFGPYGFLIIAIITCLACLKTCVGLSSCVAKGLMKVYPNGPKYNTWIYISMIVSFVLANLGVNTIVEFGYPLLNFLYPIAIIFIILTIVGKKFNYNSSLYFWVLILVFVPSFVFALEFLPENIIVNLHLDVIINLFNDYFPLFKYSFGWLLPAIIGFIIGFIRIKTKKFD